MRRIAAKKREILFPEEGLPLLAAVLNLSEDSFSGDGKENWKVRAGQLLESGVRWIDAGAESTRPGSKGVEAEREKGLLTEALGYLRSLSPDVILSADTRKADVAEAALNAGADIINDVSGLADPAMAEVIAESGAGYVLMHTRGTPETMQQKENCRYSDVTEEVSRFFAEQLKELERCGVRRDSVLLDPGIGFAKTTEDNVRLIRSAEEFHRRFDLPLFYGISRKRFIGELTGEPDASKRDPGTCGALIYLMEHGVEVLRIHNVKAAADALEMYALLNRKENLPCGLN